MQKVLFYKINDFLKTPSIIVNMKFIYGPETYRLNELAKKYIAHFTSDIIEFDSSKSLDAILEEIFTMPMFTDEKLIIIKNHSCFTDKKSGAELVNVLKQKYLGVEFLFIFETTTLDNKQPLVHYLLNHATIEEVKKLNDKTMVNTIKELVIDKGGTITNVAAIKLSIKLPPNLWIIVNEIDKLLLNNPHIDETIVEKATSDYTKDNFFALSNAILARDCHSIVRAYYDRKQLGDDEIFIIAQIASVLEVAILVNSHRKQGLTNSEISSATKIHIFRVKKGYELIDLVGEVKVKSLLQDLALLDYKIKMGKIDKSIGLDQFVLKLLQ